eukprot:UN34522
MKKVCTHSYWDIIYSGRDATLSIYVDGILKHQIGSTSLVYEDSLRAEVTVDYSATWVIPDNPRTVSKYDAKICGDNGDDADDKCPNHDDNVDADADGVPDGCDKCEGHPDNEDGNLNGHPDGCDNKCSAYDFAEGVQGGDTFPCFDDTTKLLVGMNCNIK